MATPALATVPSLRIPQAAGMLSCLAGFSPAFPEPAFPASAREKRPLWSQTDIDADLLHLEHDPQLAAQIMRKRKQERDRNMSRLTPRMQRIGLDIAALDTQVDHKQACAVTARDEESHYLDGMNLKGKLVDMACSAVQARLTQRHKECVDYSLVNLDKHHRREWDLSDPQQLKKDKPGRIEGAKVPISSFQKFESEEGVASEVLKAKRAEHLEWLMSQMADKKSKEEHEKVIDSYHDGNLLKANDLRIACDLAAIQERHAEVMETARENEELATARTARTLAARERAVAATKKHMAQETEYNLMRERHDFSIGTNGKRRDYKRCSYEEECQTWDTNRAMVQAKINRKYADAHMDDGYCHVGAVSDILGQQHEAAYKSNNEIRRKRYDDANKVLAQEKKDRIATEKHEYTSFAPSR